MSNSTSKVRTSLACGACKKRKAKCSGGPPPCKACKVSGTACVIDESLDGRRKAAAKRTFDELIFHKAFIENLLTYVRDFDHASVDQLMDLIKADVPISEIGAMLDERLRASHEETRTEESTQALRLDLNLSRRTRRKVEEAGRATPSPTSTISTIQVPQFENQALRVSDHEALVSFFRNSSYDEIDDLIQHLRSTPATSFFDGLMQYITERGSHTSVENVSGSRQSSSLAIRSGPSVPGRTPILSLPNLFQYRLYIQSLFSEYAATDLQEELITDSHGRKAWHPALKSKFSSSGTESDFVLSNVEDGANDGIPEPRPRSTDEVLSGQNRRNRAPKMNAMIKDRSAGILQQPSHDRQRRTMDTDIENENDIALSSPSSRSPQAHRPESVTADSHLDVVLPIGKGLSELKVPLYQVLPLTGMDDSPLARSYTSYRDEARQMLLRGLPMQQICGLTNKIQVNLLFRPRYPADDHSVCNWASELCAAFRGDFEMPWIMAFALLLSRLMRWLLIPTEQSYEDIPTAMRPTQNQIFIPHNPAADLAPIPAIRDALCVRFRDFVTPLIHNSRFHWPASLEEAVEHDPTNDDYILTQKFEEYAGNTDNWSISHKLTEVFPELNDRADINFYD